MAVVMLVDNGSVRSCATHQLRRIAGRLTDLSGYQVHPVSFQHADTISLDELGGIRAWTFTAFLEEKLKAGTRDFIVLPLFFGMSRALTSYVPQQVEQLRQAYGEFNVQLADILYPLPSGEPRLVDIIHHHIGNVSFAREGLPCEVVLVDHGSPVSRITEVRKHIAGRLHDRLPPGITLEQAAMERRAGAEYDFNGPLLLQHLQHMAQRGSKRIVIAMQFLLPGKHAGVGGDVHTMCSEVASAYPDTVLQQTPLISDHPDLISILNDRLQACLTRLN